MTPAPPGNDGVDDNALAQRMIRRIAQAGPMTLAEYMAMALTAPGDGYYMSGDPFGARGDFVTAPEISQMFGELIGLWCADQWQRLGEPAEILLVELGPGRGTLMADALRAIRLVPDFLAALRVHLVEVSPALRSAQATALANSGLAAPPVWHDHLADLPEKPLLLVANEFFDALPIRQFVKQPDGWSERVVTAAPEGNALALALTAPSPVAETLIPTALRSAPPGSVVECSPATASVASEVARRIAIQGGGALVIDYGYATPPLEPSLQAVRRHRRSDLLEAPGQCDLTAHVNFGALADTVRSNGAAAHGPIGQGPFLEALGIRQRAKTLTAQAAAAQVAAIDAALSRLTGPDAMGALFKALAILPSGSPTPAGFPVVTEH